MNRFVLLLFAACGTTAPTETPDGGLGSADTCDSFVQRLQPGSRVHVDSTQTGGNPQRDYCITVPSSASTIELDLTGGDCGQFQCSGDDVKMYLKRGAMPDAFEPDASTTAWTYTPDPNGFGTYVKAAQPGAWYLGIIDDQNTLGYSGVAMEVRL